jgi:ferrochelatase
MPLSYDAILLIAFGGPSAAEEIRPFLSRITKGVAIPPARLEEVAQHYEAVGGKSPLNEITFRQADALRDFLSQRGTPRPVYVAMRNSRPFFTDTLRQMHERGMRRALGFILSSHRSAASWERYQQNIAEARAELENQAPEIDYAPGWHDHPLFIQTWTELIGKELAALDADERRSIPIVFTAHSLPVAMAARSPYVEQLNTSARLIAGKLARTNWCITYQSRSGTPAEPWLEPDVADVIRAQAAGGAKQLIVAPIGFVCDHVEVLYDLDIEARKVAHQYGVRLRRAGCPNDHPTFIGMMADVIERFMGQVLDGG